MTVPTVSERSSRATTLDRGTTRPVNSMKPPWNCARAIIIRDAKILAIEYSDEGGEFYALPGGKQLHGETLPEALERECRQELGASVQNLGSRFIREYIGKYGESSWRDADVHQVELIFECGLDAGAEPKGGSHTDHDQVGVIWLSIAAISDVRLYPKELIEYLGRPLPARIEFWGNVE